MKTNENNRDNKTTDGGTTDRRPIETVQKWWDGLTAAEKQFAYDLNDLTRGILKNGFGDVKTVVDGAKQKLRAAVQRLSVAYDSAGVQSPGGGPERWRWN